MIAKHILIIDDHTLFRTGLKLILTQSSPDTSIAEAKSIKDASEIASLPIDIILLDIHLPGINGLDGIKLLNEKLPGVPIIILSASTDPGIPAEVKTLGASGFLHKASAADEIIEAINNVLSGQNFWPSNAYSVDNERLRSLSGSLTPRQIEVLMYLCEGKPNKLIARSLDMSENTVRVHVSAILAALGAKNRTEAILIAQREGLSLSDLSE